MLYCRQCGNIRRPADSACRACGDLGTPTAGFVRPSAPVATAILRPSAPWRQLAWGEGGVASLSGGAGTGKSTIAARLHAPDEGVKIGAWISTEQIPAAVGAMCDRLQIPMFDVAALSPSNLPLPAALRALSEVASAPGSITVMDSLTPLGPNAGMDFLLALIEDCRNTGRRALVINHTNKDDKTAGSSSIEYMVDVVLSIQPDTFGRRILQSSKNRFGALFQQYFDIDSTGHFVTPNFSEAAHSVEGRLGSYELVPYGMASGSIPGVPGRARGRTQQHAGLLDALAEAGVLTHFIGRASAAMQSPATRSGWMEPPDVSHRRRLAEEHGLSWLTVEDGVEALGLAAKDAEAKDDESKGGTPAMGWMGGAAPFDNRVDAAISAGTTSSAKKDDTA